MTALVKTQEALQNALSAAEACEEWLLMILPVWPVRLVHAPPASLQHVHAVCSELIIDPCVYLSLPWFLQNVGSLPGYLHDAAYIVTGETITCKFVTLNYNWTHGKNRPLQITEPHPLGTYFSLNCLVTERLSGYIKCQYFHVVWMVLIITFWFVDYIVYIGLFQVDVQIYLSIFYLLSYYSKPKRSNHIPS